MPLVIRENLPAYLSDLKKWLCEARDIPLEEMDHFFTARIAGYEAHMACWGEAYRRLAQAVPGNCRRLLDKTTPRLIQFHILKNAVNPPFLGGFLFSAQ